MKLVTKSYKTTAELMAVTYSNTLHVPVGRDGERCAQVFYFKLPSWQAESGWATNREGDPRLEPIKENLKDRFKKLDLLDMWSEFADPDGANQRHKIVLAFPAKDADKVLEIGNAVGDELITARPGHATIFAGVNEGYQGDAVSITDPAEAVGIVRSTLQSIVEESGDPSHYAIYPGVAVYDRARGCPQGGEAVATLLATGPSSHILSTARELRGKLNQSTLAVGGDMLAFGQQTMGFTIRVSRPMGEVAAVWQAEAAKQNAVDDLYVACGVYKTDEGTVIKADANPSRYTDLAKWEGTAVKVANAVGHQLGVLLEPEFDRVSFTSFRTPSLA